MLLGVTALQLRMAPPVMLRPGMTGPAVLPPKWMGAVDTSRMAPPQSRLSQFSMRPALSSMRPWPPMATAPP